VRRAVPSGSGKRRYRTNKIDNAVGHAQGARGLDAAAQLHDLGAQLPAGQVHSFAVGRALLLQLQTRKVLVGEVHEARPNVLPDQVLGLGVLALGGDLDLELAGAEAEVEHRLAAVGLAVGLGAVGIAQAAGARGLAHAGIVLLHLVEARDAEIDAALADKGGDVGGGEEDEGDGQVLDKGDVEAVLAAELDVSALEEVKGGGEQAALCDGWSVEHDLG
jgi:hypothetical protein